MRFLIDVHHPAHVHFFRHFVQEIVARGYEYLIVARDKDCTVQLLEEYRLEYEPLSDYHGGMVGLAREMVERHLRLGRIIDRFRPDQMIGIAGLTITHHGRWWGIPTTVFTDTDHARLSHHLFLKSAHRICTPSCYPRRYGRRQIRYPSYHELAYLHPQRFSRAQSRRVLASHGIDPDERYIVCRFVSWQAAHDLGMDGLSNAQKRRLVEALAQHGKVFLTSEASVPPDLADRVHAVPIADIHHLLAWADLYIGEGATMASESVVLGTPAIYINPLRCCYTSEQEKRYGLLKQIEDSDPDRILAAAEEFLDPGQSERLARSHAALIGEKSDLTDWMVGELLPG